MTIEQMKIIVTIISALIGGVTPIIVEFVRAKLAKQHKDEPDQEILVPTGYTVHNTKKQKSILPLVWIITFTIIGAIAGLLISTVIVASTSSIPSETLVESETPTAIISTTPTPVSDNESLILIAEFEDRSNGEFSGIDERERIFSLLQEYLSESETIQLEKTDFYLPDSETAQQLLISRNATIIIWGWYDSIGVNLVIENSNEKISNAINSHEYDETQTNPSNILSNQTSRDEFIFASPSNFIHYFGTLIPAKSAYVTFLTLGLLEFGTQNLPVAIHYLNLAINIIEDNQIDEAIAWDAYFLLGEAYRYQGNDILAIEAYTKSLELHVTPEAFFGRGIAKYYSQSEHVGDSCGETHMINDALVDLEEAINLNPGYAEAYWGVGWLKNKKRDYEEALEYLNKSIELDPMLARTYLNRGISYSSLGEGEKAIEDYQKTIELGYHRPSIAYQNLALTYQDLSEYSNALSQIETAIDLEPNYYYLYMVRGHIFLSLNEEIYAETELNKAQELNPKWGSYWLANFYYQINDFENAIEAMTQAIEIDPNCSVFYSGRAVYYLWGKNRGIPIGF